jgi:hypothetical protein
MAAEHNANCEEIRRLYENEGFSLAEIGKIYDISPGTARSRARKAGLRPQKSGPRGIARDPDAMAQAREILRLHEEEGMSWRQLGERFGMSKASARLRAVKAGLPVRPIGRPRKHTRKETAMR